MTEIKVCFSGGSIVVDANSLQMTCELGKGPIVAEIEIEEAEVTG